MVLLLAVAVPYSSALRFFLAPNTKKCLKEEIHKNIVVTGDYELSEAPGQQASVHVSKKSWDLGKLFFIIYSY